MAIVVHPLHLDGEALPANRKMVLFASCAMPGVGSAAQGVAAPGEVHLIDNTNLHK